VPQDRSYRGVLLYTMHEVVFKFTTSNTSGCSGINFKAIAGRDDKDYGHAERGLTYRYLWIK
jgi:hypothetical protein